MSTKFFLSYLNAPGLVGAIVPSSVFLAKALCQHARGARHIIELGAGTGAITRYLHEEFPEVTLMVVEQDGPMAAALERRFGKDIVVADTIQSRQDLISGIPDQSVVVSSLPFRSFPETIAMPVISLLRDFLLASPERRLVQYTYGQRVPFRSPHQALVWKRQNLVLRNIPPAWIWTLQQSDTKHKF